MKLRVKKLTRNLYFLIVYSINLLESWKIYSYRIIFITLNVEIVTRRNIALIKSRAKFCTTHVAFSSRDFFFHLCANINVRGFFYNLFFCVTFFWPDALKGIVNRAEPYQCDIRLVSQILWHQRISSSLKEWRLWQLILTRNFLPKFLLASIRSAIPMKAAKFHWKKLMT